MFDQLSGRIQEALRRLRSQGHLTEASVGEGIREIRRALLEADVNLQVVQDFLAKVKERAVGAEVLASLSPGQQLVGIVHEELEALLTGPGQKLQTASMPPTVVVLCGLQGSGKTTTAGKLGLYLRSRSHLPMLVSVDTHRPAAREQLATVAQSVQVRWSKVTGEDPVDLAARALYEARQSGSDYLLVDTAGRLQIDQKLMDELAAVVRRVVPTEILYVADAMSGQDAVRSAAEFHRRVQLTGIILTKLDGDARGGAALSVRSVTGVPIKFVGTGEKPGDLEAFHPDRMASRILGMGDVLSLVEKAQTAFDQKEAEAIEKKLRKQEFTLQDFLDQMGKIRRMGSLQDILGMIPGLPAMAGAEVDEKKMVRTEAIIRSMTAVERRRPEILDGSRRRRIARGSGTSVQEVNALLRQFKQARKMMRVFSGSGPRPSLRSLAKGFRK
ncbi:MAG TPA: signal recognition particle protein [Candidatus Polarisedimenticolia bacterium]|jgi:signal recognition particle subunit SRP54|nr:signal recognition particle protein [Candidatus Polarisedimenticolia bacterium]